MNRRIVYQSRLHIPTVIGEVVRIAMPVGTRVLAVMWTGSRLELSCEQRVEPAADEKRAFIIVPCDVQFELPANNRYVGTVNHPAHGPVHVYDVSPT